MNIKIILLGGFAGLMLCAIVCVLISFGSSLLAGYVNHPLEAWSWLFRVSAGSSVTVMAAATMWLERQRLGRKVYWLAGLVASFLAVALAGTLGAIVVESSLRDISTVNLGGYLVWGPIYALAFLPFTWPLATLTLLAIQRVARPSR